MDNTQLLDFLAKPDTTDAPRIVECHIIWPNRKTGRCQATAMVLLDNGEIVDALSWYSDELDFYSRDFEGKTLLEVGNLFTRRDIAYLQS